MLPALVAVVLLIWGAGKLGLAARTPLLAVAPIVTAAAVASYAVDYWHRPCSRWKLHARVALKTLAVAACIYLTGWGPMLVVGLLYPVADTLENFGAGAAAAAIGWVTVAVAAGQVAVAYGLAPSMVRPSTVQGLAALALAGLVAAALYLRLAIVRRSEAQAALAREQERFRALVQRSSDVILVTGIDGEILYASPSAHSIASGEGGAARLHDAVHPDDLELLDAMLEQARESAGATASDEIRVQMRDGSWHWIELVATNLLETPAVEGVVMNGRDVTERKLAESDLAMRATHDPLTGLPNRALLLERLEQALARTSRAAGQVAVLYVDLDRFKEVNDRFGHEAGDLLLVTLVERMRALLRHPDTLARIGGDELVVLLEPLGPAGPAGSAGVDVTERAASVATRLIACCEEPVHVEGNTLEVSASVGIAICSAGCKAVEAIRRADLAMYRAKREGRARYAIAAPSE